MAMAKARVGHTNSAPGLQALKAAAAGLLLFSASVLAQQPAPASDNFNLFENLENTAANNRASSRNTQGNRQSNAAQTSPVFTLVGTSRIGSKQTALLKHLGGDVIRVPLTGSVNPIPGHDLYSVVNYGAGQVAVRYPSAISCGDFADQGISCDPETNIATLSLTTADAIVRLAEVEPETPAPEQEEAAPDTPRNPFEALRDRARAVNAGDAPPPERFQPRRIDPADVPPGMRVVSTPFGDRLVENN